MQCFYCGTTIGSKVRWVIVMGERVPFHPPTASFDCVNEHNKKELATVDNIRKAGW